MPGIRHIAVEHQDAAGLDLARTSNDCEEGRLADPVGADHPDHAAGREGDHDVVERGDAAIALRDAFQAGDWRRRPIHRAAVRCSAAGQVAAGSVST
jgi:hypothetical protein